MKIKFLLLSLLSFLTVNTLFSQKPANETLFNHALYAPDSVEGSFHALASYLKAPAQNDREIAETIFYWVAINIAYYNDPAFEISYPENIAETTLLTKKSGCEGTARLYYELCTAAQIECEVIFGFAEGLGTDGGRISNPNHGWNAVKIDGKWELVDATWGGGGSVKVDGSLAHMKELDMRYFFADPEDFSIDHFPQQKKWQLLDKPISKKTFYSDFYELKRMAKLAKYN
jgi:transglutaminase/protease-like cytokinesis protein 3